MHPHARQSRRPASSTLAPPFDIKAANSTSIGGYKYIAYFVDSYSRYIFISFLKSKSEVIAAELVVAEFNALAVVPPGLTRGG